MHFTQLPRSEQRQLISYYKKLIREEDHGIDPKRLQIEAETAAHLEAHLRVRRNQLQKVHLVKPSQRSFAEALYSTVDTTGEIPVVKPEQKILLPDGEQQIKQQHGQNGASNGGVVRWSSTEMLYKFASTILDASFRKN